MSLVTVPISLVLPFGSMAVSLTGTPVAFVGIGNCMWRYSIQAPMSASDIAGVSLDAGVWSVIEPVIVKLCPCGTAVNGTVIVVLLGPLPKV